jgi:RNase P subunit RPR2
MSDEERDDTGLFQLICPHCKEPVPIPTIRAFEQQQLVFARCGSCGKGITKQQIDNTYREYLPRKESEARDG